MPSLRVGYLYGVGDRFHHLFIDLGVLTKGLLQQAAGRGSRALIKGQTDCGFIQTCPAG